MTHSEIVLTIIGMFVVSFIPRALPPLFLAKRPVPKALAAWLKYVPTSVFGALVFSEIFVRDGHAFDFAPTNISFWASLLVLGVAVKTHSLAWSIVSGLTAFWLLEHYVF